MNQNQICDDGTGRSDCVGLHAQAQAFQAGIDPNNLSGTARQTGKSAADLQTERLVAASPQTTGQKMLAGWQSGAIEHPAAALGLKYKK